MNDARVRVKGPRSIDAGSEFSIHVTIKNIGTTTWVAGGYYRLGSQSPQDNKIWGYNRKTLNRNISPGESYTFNFTLNAPDTGGSYLCSWQMVQDGVEWFGTNDFIRITVNPKPVVSPLPLPPTVDDVYINPNNIYSAPIFNTQAYIMDGISKSLYWENKTNWNIKLVKAYLWTGVDTDGIADCHVDMRRVSDGSIIHILQWDHYTNPTAPNHGTFIDHDYMLLKIGDKIKFNYVANPAPESRNKHAHNIGIIWVKYA